MALIIVEFDVSCGGWGVPPARAGVQEQPQRRLHLAGLLRGIAFPRQSPAFLRARGSMTKAQLSMVAPIAIWDQQLVDAQVGDPPGHNQLGDRQPTLEQPFAGIPMETPPRLACRAGHHSARWHPLAAHPWASKWLTGARYGVVDELAALTRRAGLILAPGPEAPCLAQPRQKAFGSLAFQIAFVRFADHGARTATTK